jgi:hypothetical protein
MQTNDLRLETEDLYELYNLPEKEKLLTFNDICFESFGYIWASKNRKSVIEIQNIIGTPLPIVLHKDFKKSLKEALNETLIIRDLEYLIKISSNETEPEAGLPYGFSISIVLGDNDLPVIKKNEYVNSCCSEYKWLEKAYCTGNISYLENCEHTTANKYVKFLRNELSLTRPHLNRLELQIYNHLESLKYV